MISPRLTFKELVEHVLAAPRAGRRRVIALAGGPASGKSTLAKKLADHLDEEGCAAQVVPMDGYHLHNQILIDRGLLNRKGAPETFDALGFVHLVARLHDEAEVFYPIFDRKKDIAIAGGGVIEAGCDTVIVEGNYLLHDTPIWRDLSEHWDLSVRLDVESGIVKDRLIERWLAHGLSIEQAEMRAAENDLINAQSVAEMSLPSDVTICP